MAARKKPAPKRGASRYQAPAKKPVPGWIWLVCGLVIGGFIMFLMNLEPGGDEIKRAKDTPKPKEQPKRNPPATGQPVKPKYDFYTLLPESEVILPPEAPKPEPPKPVTEEEAAKIDAARAEAALNGQVPPPPPMVAKAPVTQFFLQAGSFRKQAEAERVRAQIILLGQNVRVENVTVRDEDWYRVLVGPYANREQLGQAQKTLSSSGYNNLLLQQRQTR
ncbi:SPOR domain-containing protein [Stutzerimonas stutzeri]|uniref:Cell division protein n=1 Tax=Stutzerimonas stutzeri TaxID=316 RepID=A0A172WQ14_STUST|nr:SPOR domain-containing protein [Stutzerimonas stutzeri]ANF25552.1 cell division protein [Stutzerimonas stutzeri]